MREIGFQPGVSTMRKIHIYLLLLLSLAVFGVSPQAAGVPEPRATVSPMMQEVQTALAQEATAIQALQNNLANAHTEQDALRILREISQRKQDTEIAVLGIQVRYARRAGHEEAAVRMEQAIARILDPEPVEPSPEARREAEALRAAEQHRD